MKNKHHILPLMLLLTSMIIAVIGGYLKYTVLSSMNVYQDETVIAVPFLLLSDTQTRYKVQMALNLSDANEDTEPITAENNQLDDNLPVQLENEAPSEIIIEDPSEATSVPTEIPTEIPTETPTEPPSEPPTEPDPVEDSWFDDALFIGDSRTKSMSAQVPLGKAHYFCDHGISVFDVRYKKCHSKDFYSTRLDALLAENTYGKVYIMLGINSMYMPHEETIKEYKKLIELIQELQPDAAIIMHSVMTVGREKAKEKNFSLENIYSLNDMIAELAVDGEIYYIDVNEWIADEDGYLPDGVSNDGVHFYGNLYLEWAQWLRESAATLGIS